ncbi:MAG TPA: hypothetical protein VGR73_12070 [Bryobacteraceae bacterium]|nr:hypothetical protein [Bryobacteraceae bacterium]
MKYCLLTLVPAALLAQSVATTYTVDINGRRVEANSLASSKAGEKTEISQSVNGKLVPKEQTETRVISQTPGEKVTETFDRKFDENGQLVSTERVLTTERKTADGGSSTQATVYRSDLNGPMQEAERRKIDTRPQGPARATSDVTIARPAIGGGFETVEQRKIVKTEEPNRTHEEQTVYLKSTSGDFVEKRRTQTDSQKSGDKTQATIQNYEADYTGRMALLNQETSTTVASKDGKQVIERDIYASASDGVPRDEQGGQKLKEHQTIVRTPGAGGSVTETVSVQRPTLADQAHLGAPVQISETVCTGKCEAGKP